MMATVAETPGRNIHVWVTIASTQMAALSKSGPPHCHLQRSRSSVAVATSPTRLLSWCRSVRDTSPAWMVFTNCGSSSTEISQACVVAKTPIVATKSQLWQKCNHEGVMIQVIRQPSDSNLGATFLGHDEVEKPDLRRAGSMSERAMLGLPPDLEDLVLARLPIAVLYKARPVCKRWYSLLTNPLFLSLRNAIQGPQDASFFPLVFWNDGKATLRISRTGSKLEAIGDLEPILLTDANSVVGEACATWSWLGYDSARRRWQAMKPFATPVDVKNVITGSKGLLCLRGESSLLVLNPMTGAQREVPLKEHVVQLVVNTERSSFRILCAASRKRTKIFDSQTGLWSKRGRPAPNLALEEHIGAYCHGVLYCVAREERSGRWGVAQYDVEGARTWSTSLVFFPQLPGEFVLKAKVIQFSGEIFALLQKEISEDDLGPRTKSLALWKLEIGSSHNFRLAGTMPTYSRHHLVNLDDLDFVALNNRLCILNKSTFKAVACLISVGVVTAWQEFPLDSYFSADTPLVERCIVQFAFEPNLMVSV